jgi:hypothetical protein
MRNLKTAMDENLEQRTEEMRVESDQTENCSEIEEDFSGPQRHCEIWEINWSRMSSQVRSEDDITVGGLRYIPDNVPSAQTST